MNDENANTQRQLIVNLSGDQKRVLGIASWRQVGLTATGGIIGAILFVLTNKFLGFIGVPVTWSIIVGTIMFGLSVAPLAYIAFWPIRDNDGNLLYYKSTQLRIDYEFERNQIGTYLNIQPRREPVRVPPKRKKLSDRLKEGDFLINE